MTSSRRIEALCGTDVAFRVICGGSRPDHVTVARFRAAFGGAVPGLFAEVLRLCARLGMGRLGTVALDGMKIAASASKAANRSEEGLRRLAARRVAEHAAADAADDELFGAGRRGDEVPAEVADPRTGDERIAAALAQLRAGREAAARAGGARAEVFRARQRGGRRTGPAPLGAAVELAEENLARVRAARAAQIARMRARAGNRRDQPRAGIDDYCRVRRAAAKVDQARARAARAARRQTGGAGPGPVRNITDPGSRLMPVRGGGFIQGYNAQNVASEDGLIIATELTQDTGDSAWFAPMLTQAQAAAALISAHRPGAGGTGGDERIGLLLADAGYCSRDNLTAEGPDRLIATGKRRDLEKTARRPAGPEAAGHDSAEDPVAAMAARLATEDGITAYRRRGHIAETPHARIKHNMGFRQLSMRGTTKAAAEWAFACTVHNLLKAITAGHLTTQALTTLAR